MFLLKLVCVAVYLEDMYWVLFLGLTFIAKCVFMWHNLPTYNCMYSNLNKDIKLAYHRYWTAAVSINSFNNIQSVHNTTILFRQWQ